jgi:hypothetical protein
VAQVMGIRFLSQAPLCPSVDKLMGIQHGTATTNGASSTNKSTVSPSEMEEAMSAMSQVDIALKLCALMF